VNETTEHIKNINTHDNFGLEYFVVEIGQTASEKHGPAGSIYFGLKMCKRRTKKGSKKMIPFAQLKTWQYRRLPCAEQ
jgi:hypothetical protein